MGKIWKNDDDDDDDDEDEDEQLFIWWFRVCFFSTSFNQKMW